MKKVSIFLTAFVAFSLLLVSWSKAKKFDGAVHIGLDFCYVLDGDGTLQGASGNVVITPSANGHYKCKASDMANSSHQAVSWDFGNTGKLCSVEIGLDGSQQLTDDWKNEVSASGNVTLQCHVHH